jgi:methylglyoxal synthase
VLLGREGRSSMQFGTPAAKQVKQMKQKRIALVAHDSKKQDLLEWAKLNKDFLVQHKVYATKITGKLLERELHIGIIKLESGPLGGVQQIGAKIVDGDIDFLVFFGDFFASLPYDPDAGALLRIAVVWNIPVALNRISADCIFSAPWISGESQAPHVDYGEHRAECAPEPITYLGSRSGQPGETGFEGYVSTGDSGDSG